jgi:hypothetical protein
MVAEQPDVVAQPRFNIPGFVESPSKSFWMRACAAGRCSARRRAVKKRSVCVGNRPNPERYDPKLWTDGQSFLERPGQADIQTDQFFAARRVGPPRPVLRGR